MINNLLSDWFRAAETSWDAGYKLHSATQEIPRHFMGQESSLPCSQKLSIGPYSKTDEFNTFSPTVFPKDPF
jgi:hypothetical protein